MKITKTINLNGYSVRVSVVHHYYDATLHVLLWPFQAYFVHCSFEQYYEILVNV